MKKLISATVALLGALVLTSHAADPAKAGPKPDDKKETKQAARRAPLTEEQKAVRKEILAKYDTNKDGKLDASERKAMSKEDRQKFRNAQAAPAKGKKKAK